MVLLKVEDLSVSFRTFSGLARVVENVEFELGEGESLSIVGESGSGKTTVLRAILGLLPPNAVPRGSILFEGRDILTMSEDEKTRIRGSMITYIPQEPLVALNPFFTIREHFVDRLLFGSKPKIGFREYLEYRKKADEVVEQALKYMRLTRVPDPETVLDYYPMQLSGGMLQRVLIALALVSEPKLLLADEPTTALDVITQLEILELLRKLQEDLGLSIIYVTHDLGVAKAVSDRVIVMYGGHMVEMGGTEDVLLNPMHPYTQGLVEAIPKLVGGEPKGIEGSLPDYLDPPPGCRFHPRCPKAMDICREKRPPGFRVNDRIVYCWLYGDRHE